MASTKGAPPKPWESNARTEESGSPDPVAVFGEMLLGKAGPPTAAIATREIRASSALVLGGVTLGVAGFGAIALAQGQAVPQHLRELGGVLGGAGLLVLLWGILAGLPGHRLLRVVGLVGAFVGAVGMAAFVWAYPEQWGKPGVADHTVGVLGTYVAGVVLLVGATFGALIADFVLRMQVKSRLRDELGREPSDAEIQADIDYAMRRHKVTWGGLAEDTGKGLTFKAEPLPAEYQAIMPKFGRETIAEGERKHAVDHAVDALTAFRGGRMRTDEMPEAGLGDASDALRALRNAQGAKPVKRTWLDRLLGRWPKPPPGYADLTRAGPPRQPGAPKSPL
jgi:hypothetical protein